MGHSLDLRHHSELREPCARLVAREDLTDSLAIFRFAPPAPALDFRAGQWTKLGLPDPKAGGELVWRPYTIASSPQGAELRFYVRRVWKPAPGRMTSLLWKLEPGARIQLTPPRGRFTLDRWRAEGPPRTLLLLAGGTGLAPFVAHVEDLWRSGAPAPVVLCHGASYEDEFGFRARFEELSRARSDAEGRAWSFRYLPTVSRPDHPRNSRWRGSRGRVEALLASCGATVAPLERALGHALDPARTFAMACGYTRTLDNVLAELRARGFVGPREREDGRLDVLLDSFGDDRES